MLGFINTNYCVAGFWLVVVPVWLLMVVPLSASLAREGPGQTKVSTETAAGALKRRAGFALWFVLGVVTLPGAMCAIAAGGVALTVGVVESLVTGGGFGLPAGTNGC